MLIGACKVTTLCSRSLLPLITSSCNSNQAIHTLPFPAIRAYFTCFQLFKQQPEEGVRFRPVQEPRHHRSRHLKTDTMLTESVPKLLNIHTLNTLCCCTST